MIGALPVVVFDWPAWAATEEARALLDDERRIAEASPEQLIKLATALVRSDRFNDGTLASAFTSGLLLAMARRAATLARGAPSSSA